MRRPARGASARSPGSKGAKGAARELKGGGDRQHDGKRCLQRGGAAGAGQGDLTGDQVVHRPVDARAGNEREDAGNQEHGGRTAAAHSRDSGVQRDGGSRQEGGQDGRKRREVRQQAVQAALEQTLVLLEGEA